MSSLCWLTFSGVLGDASGEVIPVKHGLVIIDILGHHPHLRVSRQWLSRSRLVMSQDVKVPHGSAVRVVPIQRPRQVDLPGVLVDHECLVVTKLAGQVVPDPGFTLSVWIFSVYLEQRIDNINIYHAINPLPADHDNNRFQFVLLADLNHCYWKWNSCLNVKICKYLVSNSTNMRNFQPLEVVDRGSETQSQVVENLNINLAG